MRCRCLELWPDLRAVVLPLDLKELSHLRGAAERAKGLFGRVDVLVNNGGVGFRGLGQETSIEVDQLVMDVDFFSGVVLTKALLPEWIQRPKLGSVRDDVKTMTGYKERVGLSRIGLYRLYSTLLYSTIPYHTIPYHTTN